MVNEDQIPCTARKDSYEAAKGILCLSWCRKCIRPFTWESMGVNTKNLLISNPDYAEYLWNIVDALTESGAVDVVVVDNVAVLVPKCELD